METNETVIKCNDGWKDLYQPIIDEIIKFDNSQNNVFNKIGIKSVINSLGELTILLYQPHNLPDKIKDMIIKAKTKSLSTCEFCGTTQNVGTTINKNYVICCKSCWEKHIKATTQNSFWTTLKN